MTNFSNGIKFIIIILTLVVLTLITYLVFSYTQKTLDPITLRLNWTKYTEHAPFYVAKDLGYYKDAGLDVDILAGSGSNITVATVAKGKYEIGYVSANAIIQGIDGGLPIKSVATFCQHETSSFIFRKDKNIQTLQDIKGKRIAASIGDAVINEHLIRLGLSPNDLEIIRFPNATMKEDALMLDEADILIGYFLDQVARLEYKYNIPFDYIKYSDYGIDNLSSSIVVSNEFIQKRPDVLFKFLKATQKGFAFTRDNPKKAAEIFFNNVPTASLSRINEMIEAFIPLFHTPNSVDHPLGWASPKDWINTKQNLDLSKSLESGDESWINMYFTNEFLSEIY